MLKYLSISNFILIDNLEIDFTDGFNVVSGETGAGKSLILAAISLICGKRINVSVVRDKNIKTTIVAEFNTNEYTKNILKTHDIDNIDDLGDVDNDHIIIRRVIYPSNKSKSFINDTPVSLALLTKVTQKLIVIYGQHQTYDLLDNSNHINMLDKFAAPGELAAEVSRLYYNLCLIKDKLSKLKQYEDKTEREIDYWQHVVNEIEQLNIQENEEDYLLQQRIVLKQKQKLIDAVETVRYELLCSDNITNKIYKIQKIIAFSDKFAAINEALDNVIIQFNEIEIQVDDVASDILNEENNLEQIEERLFLLHNAARKYNMRLEDLYKHLDYAYQKLHFFENITQEKQQLEIQLENIKQSYLIKAQLLSKLREDASLKLAEQILKHLIDLRMNNIDIKIECLKLENYAANGINKVNFLICTSKQQGFVNIELAASGGELSRFMLALRMVLSDDIPVNIFDEIDTGIGGAVANAVGKKLYNLAEKKQLIVISHQPQVVVYANHHYLVQKKHIGDNIDISFIKLNSEKRSYEIARMLSGADVTKAAIEAANNLLEAAKAYHS